MKRDEALFDQIERYLRGELSEAENQAIETAIAEDPEFAAELAFQQLEMDAMDLLLEEKLRGKMAEWKQVPVPPSEAIKPKRKGWWLWGILALIVLSSLLWLLFPSPSGAPEKATRPAPPIKNQDKPAKKDLDQSSRPPIANQNKTTSPGKDPIQEAITIPALDEATTSLALASYTLPEELNGTLKSPDDPANTILDQGLVAFSRKNYPKAIEELRKITLRDGEATYLEGQQLLGHAYFLNQQYAQAVRVFSGLSKITNPDYSTTRQEAEWYLILSLLPNYTKNREQIQQGLLPMVDSANFHNYQREAEALVEKLKKLPKN